MADASPEVWYSAAAVSLLTMLQLRILLEEYLSLHPLENLVTLVESLYKTKPKPSSTYTHVIESRLSAPLANGADLRSLTSESTAPPTSEHEVTSAWDYLTPYVCTFRSEDLYTMEAQSPPSPSSKLLYIEAGILETAPKQSIHRGEVSLQKFTFREDGLLTVSDRRQILSQGEPGFEVPSFFNDISDLDPIPSHFDMCIN